MTPVDWRALVTCAHRAPIVHCQDEDGHEWWTWSCSCGHAAGTSTTGKPNDERNHHVALMAAWKRRLADAAEERL